MTCRNGIDAGGCRVKCESVWTWQLQQKHSEHDFVEQNIEGKQNLVCGRNSVSMRRLQTNSSGAGKLLNNYSLAPQLLQQKTSYTSTSRYKFQLVTN